MVAPRKEFPNRGKLWTAKEEQFLRLNFGAKSIGELAKFLGRNENGVWARLLKLGLVTMAAIPSSIPIPRKESPAMIGSIAPMASPSTPPPSHQRPRRTAKESAIQSHGKCQKMLPSLTNLITKSDVRNRFSTDFPMPEVKISLRIRSPVLTSDPTIIGTAFDYLLRFYLERLNPGSVKHDWIAEQTLQILEPHSMVKQKVVAALDLAKKAHSKYQLDGKTTDDLLKAALSLAKIDVIYRTASTGVRLTDYTQVDLEDLRNLFNTIEPSSFKTDRVCVLNPTFGPMVSSLVGRADADILLDEMLVDIKTVKRLRLQPRHYRQLLAYYTLWRITGTIDGAERARITSLGIYFSRHGVLYSFPVPFITNEDFWRRFTSWFEERARAEVAASMTT